MIEDDIRKLDARDGKRALDQLESQIWAGVDARMRARRVSRAVFSCQAAVLAISVVSSVVAGTHVGMSAARATPNVLLVASDLTLSSRLMGR